MTGRDFFETKESDYAQFRPRYPQVLFEYVTGLCPARDRAWDCATGNGQAATGLAKLFTQVIATDLSKSQLLQAKQVDNVHYWQASAESSCIESHSIDLLVVAQALHWFDLEKFYREVNRVLKPAGLLLVISYQLPRINKPLNAIIDKLHGETLGAYWPQQRRHVDSAYRDIPFPFPRLELPTFSMQHKWSIKQFSGYLRSWSAVSHFQRQQANNPVDLIDKDLQQHWSVTGHEMIRWPLTLLAGRAF